jgi:hypothetical protein
MCFLSRCWKTETEKRRGRRVGEAGKGIVGREVVTTVVPAGEVRSGHLAGVCCGHCVSKTVTFKSRPPPRARAPPPAPPSTFDRTGHPLDLLDLLLSDSPAHTPPNASGKQHESLPIQSATSNSSSRLLNLSARARNQIRASAFTAFT